MRPAILLALALAPAVASCQVVRPRQPSDILAAGAHPRFADDQLDRIGLRLLWESPIQKPIGSMYLLDDQLYVESEDNRLYAVDAATGEVQWVVDLGGRLSYPPSQYRWKKEDPATAGHYDEVYCVVGDRLLRIDREIGAVEWSEVLPFAPASTPVAGPSHVYIGAWDDRVYAIHKDTRIITWRFLTDGDVTATPAYPPPQAATTAVVFFASDDGNTYAADSGRGDIRWSFKTGGQVVAGVLFYQNRVYVGSTDYNLYCLDSADGALKWQVETGAPVTTTPVAIRNTLYTTSDGNHLYAVHLIDDIENEKGYWKGDVKWRTPHCRQVLAEGRKTVYLLNDQREICAVDAGAGTPIWKYPFRSVDFFVTNDADKLDKTRPEVAARGGTIFLGFRSGWVVALQEKGY